MQAQAELQAEAMRKKLEEKRQERVAVVKALTPPPVRRAVPGDAGVIGREQEPRIDQGESEVPAASPRKVWGVPGAAGGNVPVLARQVDATGVISGGGCVCLSHSFACSVSVSVSLSIPAW